MHPGSGAREEMDSALGGGPTWKASSGPRTDLRETQVMHALATGKSNKEIGSALDISESTVKVHVTHILEKLKVTGRTEAINVALKRGLVHMDQPGPLERSRLNPILLNSFPKP